MILRGTIDERREVNVRRVIDAYPDATYTETAKALAGRVRLSRNTLGTHIQPYAEVFVIFLADKGDAQFALLYGRQHEAVLSNEKNDEMSYLELIRLKEKPPAGAAAAAAEKAEPAEAGKDS